MYEFYKAMNNAKIVPINILGYIAAILNSFLIFFEVQINNIGLVIAFIIILTFVYEIIVVKHGFLGIITTIMGVIYIPFLLSHIVYIDRLLYGSAIIWLPFVTAWYTDTCAYLVGVSFGKVKLCPKVSPNKSVEGAIGGLLGCTVLTIITGIVINNIGYSIPLIHFVSIGILCGIASQFGDLAASYIKRYSGIKDFGSLIPGHGGILDRFDSIMFTAPVVFYYFIVVQSMVKW
jgi:phosphatidate cytidylyltransferase